MQPNLIRTHYWGCPNGLEREALNATSIDVLWTFINESEGFSMNHRPS